MVMGAMALGSVFAGMGVVLMVTARRSLRSGVAVTDENDRIERVHRPLLFGLFVSAQFLWGAFCALAGVALIAAALLTRSQS